MAKGQGKTGLIVTIIALGLTLVVVGTIAVLSNLNPPAVSNDTPNTEGTSREEKPEETKPVVDDGDDETTPVVDPATLSKVDIEPLAITVFYTKGTPGFDFTIKRSADRTQYVEFSSPNLVGTKCTNDEGVFASIIKNPTATEDQTTFVQKKSVGSDTYGLSLAGKSCTSDESLLDTYQTAFSQGYSQLKAME
jgi:hypothetical protein